MLKNQSFTLTPAAALSTRSLATPHEPGVGMMTSSPGCQMAGVATPCLPRQSLQSLLQIINKLLGRLDSH